MMSERNLEKLLGGFSADTLTAEERQQLYAAALHDQQLFNALADEQALKELLADPAVRRRLLQALAPTHGVSRWRSWLDRFTSPAGLAWAGGVAVVVFAVVLGLRVYEVSLRQASETAVLEGRPQVPSRVPEATPPAQSPMKEAEKKESTPVPRPEPATKDKTNSTMNSREQGDVSRRPDGPGQDQKRKARSKETSKEGGLPIGALGKAAEQPTSSPDPRSAMPAAPAAEPEVHAFAQTGAGPMPSVSAQALFQAQTPAPEIALRAQEKAVEAAPKTDTFALARKAPQRQPVVKPLAMRYNLVVEREGKTSDANVGLAADQPGSVTLTVESNQDAYMQIWRRAGDSLPELVLPAKETGRISLKTSARQPQQMTVPQESDRLIVRLSRVPFGPITRQEAVMAGRGSIGQVVESVSGTEEAATYVANPDPSVTELAIEIPLKTKASP